MRLEARSLPAPVEHRDLDAGLAQRPPGNGVAFWPRPSGRRQRRQRLAAEAVAGARPGETCGDRYCLLVRGPWRSALSAVCGSGRAGTSRIVRSGCAYFKAQKLCARW